MTVIAETRPAMDRVPAWDAGGSNPWEQSVMVAIRQLVTIILENRAAVVVNGGTCHR